MNDRQKKVYDLLCEESASYGFDSVLTILIWFFHGITKCGCERARKMLDETIEFK